MGLTICKDDIGERPEVQGLRHSPIRSLGLRTSRSRPMNNFVFIAFEGFTEINYFGMIKDNKDKLGIRDNVHILRIARSNRDRRNADPMRNANAMAEYINCIETKRYTVGIFVSEIIQNLYEEGCDKERTRKCKTGGQYNIDSGIANLKRNLIAIEDRIMEELSSSDCCEDGAITNTKDAMTICKDVIQEIIPGYFDKISEPKSIHRISFDKDLDMLCLVIDRDPYAQDSRRTAKEFNDMMRKCEDLGIHVFVTNPCFEFYLLMHDDDWLKRFEGHEEEFLRNDFVEGTRMRFAEWALNQVMQYDKRMDLSFLAKDDCRMVKTAIANAETFADWKELESKIGSSIPQLIEEMQYIHRR